MCVEQQSLIPSSCDDGLSVSPLHALEPDSVPGVGSESRLQHASKKSLGMVLYVSVVSSSNFILVIRQRTTMLLIFCSCLEVAMF